MLNLSVPFSAFVLFFRFGIQNSHWGSGLSGTYVWEVTDDEINICLWLMLLQATVSCSRIAEFWQQDPVQSCFPCFFFFSFFYFSFYVCVCAKLSFCVHHFSLSLEQTKQKSNKQKRKRNGTCTQRNQNKKAITDSLTILRFEPSPLSFSFCICLPVSHSFSVSLAKSSKAWELIKICFVCLQLTDVELSVFCLDLLCS